jgi:hypothetical protein
MSAIGTGGFDLIVSPLDGDLGSCDLLRRARRHPGRSLKGGRSLI